MTAQAAKHTPGPWRIETRHTRSSIPRYRVEPVADIRMIVPHGDPAANARLVATAPEMADFLYWLRDSPDALNIDGGRSYEAEQRLRALLARIEGER